MFFPTPFHINTMKKHIFSALTLISSSILLIEYLILHFKFAQQFNEIMKLVGDANPTIVYGGFKFQLLDPFNYLALATLVFGIIALRKQEPLRKLAFITACFMLVLRLFPLYLFLL